MARLISFYVLTSDSGAKGYFRFKFFFTSVGDFESLHSCSKVSFVHVHVCIHIKSGVWCLKKSLLSFYMYTNI